MAGRIRREDIDALRERVDVAEVIGEHTKLIRAGARLKGLCPFHDEKTPSFTVDPARGLYHCLAGETGVLTFDGVEPIAKLAGGRHRLLTTGGFWVEAEVRSYGVQRLWAVHLSRNRVRKTIFATDGHRWLLRRSGAPGSRIRGERITTALRPGDGLAWAFPNTGNLLRTGPAPFGVAHGFTYGDTSARSPAALLDTIARSPAALLDTIARSPAALLDGGTDRPALSEAPGYLYGWLAGYFAADGCVSSDGQVVLSSARRDDVEFVRTLANRLGIGTYGVKQQTRLGLGRQPTPLFHVTFVNSTLRPEFFVVEKHRQRFEEAVARKRRERKGWVVRGVEPTEREEEVFCAVVPGTHAFTLEDNLLVGNCFGCNAGGDVFTFLEQVAGLSFVEAAEQLARRTGVTLTYEELSPGQKRVLGDRSRLVAANAAALEFFRAQLYGEAGEVARAYLKQRGFGREDAERFQLGFAPLSWEALSRHLLDARIPQEDVLRAGLAARSDRGGLRDRFRGRLMFPVFDVSGDVIGFGGRVLPGLDYGEHDPPKYLNTAETPVYHKGRVLYGMSWARPEVVRTGEVLVCEGYTDVMALHQAGFTNAVATCGTAVGEDHLRLLERNASRLVLAFDSDEAGAKAAERAWSLARGREIEVRVLILPDGTDPADLVREAGVDAVRERVAAATPVVPFLVERRVGEHDIATAEGRAAAVNAAAAVVADVGDAVLRHEYTRALADRVGLAFDVVDRAVAVAGGVTPGGRATTSPRPARQPSVRSRPADGAAGRAQLERETLRIALQRPELLPARWHDVREDDFTHPKARAIFRALLAAGGPDALTAAVLDAAADDDERDLIRAVALEELTVEPDAPHVSMLVNRLLVHRLDQEIAWQKAELEQLNQSTDPEGYQTRARDLFALEARRRELLAVEE